MVIGRHAGNRWFNPNWSHKKNKRNPSFSLYLMTEIYIDATSDVGYFAILRCFADLTYTSN